MKALVVGGDGLIGAALADALVARGHLVYRTSRRTDESNAVTLALDLAAPDLGSFVCPAVDVAFISAAMTNFSECRTRPELAYKVNVAGPRALTERLLSKGVRVVFISTSAVFDCRRPMMKADAPTSGVGIYGKLKAETEKVVLSLSPDNAVVRLTKVLTDANPLLARWIRALRQGQAIDAAEDHRTSPITLRDAVTGILAVAEAGRGGIWQVSANGDVSYAEIAFEVARMMGVSETLIRPVTAAGVGIPEDERTAFTSLDTSALSKLCRWSAPDPMDVVRHVVETIFSGSDSATRNMVL